jgi:GNAT superfamily N-acetyltransferase
MAVCGVTDEGDGVFEIQNLAVQTDQQRCGYGSQMLQYVTDHYRSRCRTLIVGTGDSPITVPFYEHCGFTISRRIPRGIVDAYDHPIIENGVQLIDKVYLTMNMNPNGRTIQSS